LHPQVHHREWDETTLFRNRGRKSYSGASILWV
jgi:hypothetical protein